MTAASAFLLASLSVAAFAAAPPAAAPSGWLKLINNLGSEDHDVRKAAGEKLSGLGEDVLPALRKAGKSHDDPDVRLRVFLIIADIEKRLDREVRRFEGHVEGVLAFAASPDGKQVASCGLDGLVKLHDAATRELVKELKGHAGGSQAVAYSPDGRRLLSGGADRAVVVWDTKSGKALQKLAGHTDVVTCVAFLPGGRGAVTASYDKTLRVWNVRSALFSVSLYHFMTY